MSKSSLEYAELSGLKIALHKAKQEDAAATNWIKKRIKELEKS